MQVFMTYFLYFIIYSFLGWTMEVVCKLIEKKKFINRGFLLGPICPIYGYGVLGIVLLVGRNRMDFFAIFLKSVFICSLLEYFTSYIMEKMFHARWWDYSRRKYNINGRICLETMVPFGLLGCFVVYLLHPLVVKFVSLFSTGVCSFFAILFFILYLVDNILSFNVMNNIKGQIKKKEKDNTETIKKEVLAWIEENSFLYRHIKSSYPNFEIKRKVFKKKEKK